MSNNKSTGYSQAQLSRVSFKLQLKITIFIYLFITLTYMGSSSHIVFEFLFFAQVTII